MGVCPVQRHKMTFQHAACVSPGRLKACAVGEGLVCSAQMGREQDSVRPLSRSHVFLPRFARRFRPEPAEPRVSRAAPQATALPFASAGDT